VRGLWKPPDLWTRQRRRAHKVLGRRHTDAGAHSYHKAAAPVSNVTNGLATARNHR
jgi:hypothetical protein